MAHQIARRWFNVDEYYRMAEAGILTEDDRVELVEGEIITISPIGSLHAACVDRLADLLSDLKTGFIIRVQSPISIDPYSEPEPDIALLKRRADFYAGGHPTPGDVLLVIEVADTSIEYDRSVKVPLYARAGIPECALVNLAEGAIEFYQQPANGKYQSVKAFKRGESFASQSVPGLTLDVDAVFG